MNRIFAPFITAFTLAVSLWNASGDWGWHVILRVLAAIAVFGGILFFFVWAFCGFQWPLF